MEAKPSAFRNPLFDDAGPGSKIVRLGHDLRNSTTVLLGLLDRLEELKDRHPALGELARDLELTVNQIQAVAQSMATLGHSLRRSDQQEA